MTELSNNIALFILKLIDNIYATLYRLLILAAPLNFYLIY